MHSHTIEALNELLKGENMALHTYGRAKNWQKDFHVAHMFDKFHQDHKRHAEQLANRIIELGGTPEIKLGIAALMTQISARYNSFRGPEYILKQVYSGEDKGIHAYEDRLNQLDPSTQQLVRKIMEEDHDHLKYFKTRFEQEKAERH